MLIRSGIRLIKYWFSITDEEQHLLEQIPYEEVPYESITLPDRVYNPEYERAILPPELHAPKRY